MFNLNSIKKELERRYFIDWTEESGLNGKGLVAYCRNRKIVVSLAKFTSDIKPYIKRGTDFIAFDVYSDKGSLMIPCTTVEELVEKCDLYISRRRRG